MGLGCTMFPFAMLLFEELNELGGGEEVVSRISVDIALRVIVPGSPSVDVVPGLNVTAQVLFPGLPGGGLMQGRSAGIGYCYESSPRSSPFVFPQCVSQVCNPM